MIAAIDNDMSVGAAREFKARLNAVTLACDPLIERIAEATERDDDRASILTLRDSAKMGMHANMLYSWAYTLVPKDANSRADID